MELLFESVKSVEAVLYNINLSISFDNILDKLLF